MASKDIYNNIKLIQAVAPATVTADTTSNQIDTRGYEAVAIEVSVGNATTLSTTNYLDIKLTEASESTGTFSAVAQADVRGGQSTSSTDGTLIRLDSTSEESAVYKFGYTGGGRVLEVTVDETGTVSCPIAVTAVLGEPADAPTS